MAASFIRREKRKRWMTAAQYRAILSRLSLSQAGAAKLLQIGERTAKRWAKEGVAGPASILLRLLNSGKITIADLSRGHEQ
jgi:predicted RecB family nuclease